MLFGKYFHIREDNLQLNIQNGSNGATIASIYDIIFIFSAHIIQMLNTGQCLRLTHHEPSLCLLAVAELVM